MEVERDEGAARGPRETSSNGLGPTPRAKSLPLYLSPSQASIPAARVSEIAAEKRPASDHPIGDRLQKKSRPSHTGTIARVPPTLTKFKQERTILYVLLPGTVSDMIPIKLCSVMSITTLFSSVFATVGIEEYSHMAIAVSLERQDGAPDRCIILKQNGVETFEFFPETVDEASCWNEENGKLVLVL